MRSRRLSFRSRVLIGLALAAGPVVVVIALLLRDEPAPQKPPPPAIHAGQVKYRTIYHSSQTPGYTAWVGAWLMPDDSLMTGFVEATGPMNPAERAQTPASVLELFGTPRAEDPQRDFWGLDLSTRFLRSSDGGRRWRLDSSERFKAIGP
ncbi:MAG TPA: hypothetical protein VFY44_10325, partial [Thermoleophilaceae bacterium]|nr:hypothetical protein [Thermoleophilaceae bacterium]